MNDRTHGATLLRETGRLGTVKQRSPHGMLRPIAVYVRRRVGSVANSYIRRSLLESL